jgi:triosephosphate isomerase
MKKLLIVANWKSNKTTFQAKEWFEQIPNIENKEVVVCPSFTSLLLTSSIVKERKLSVRIGAQNISPFDQGSFTGEVNGEQIKEFADYVLVGHSERRKNFLETEEIVFKKIELALKFNLIPIVCISELSQVQRLKSEAMKNKLIIAYEPLFAIDSGKADSPENADKISAEIKNQLDGAVLYGGSVTPQNVSSFTSMLNIDGVLVGKASLDTKEFGEIIKNA